MKKKNDVKLLREEAYEKIRNSIIRGDYEANSIIYESAVAKELNISRTPIREAMTRLSEEGLVKNLKNNGFLIVLITLNELKEIFDLRQCMEKFVIEEIFARDIDYDLSQAEHFIQIQEKAFEANDPWLFFNANNSFHLELIKLLGNVTLTKVMGGLSEKRIQSQYQALRNKENLTNSISEHLKILDALKDRNKEGAIEAILQHIINSKKRLFGIN